MKAIRDIETAISFAVAEHYIRTGGGSSVADIAAHIGCSLATTYRAIHREEGIPGIISHNEIAAGDLGPNLPNAQKLGPYFPAPWFLRQLILEGRIVNNSDTGEKADMAIVRNGFGGHYQKTQRGHTPQTKEGHS